MKTMLFYVIEYRRPLELQILKHRDTDMIRAFIYAEYLQKEGFIIQGMHKEQG